MSEDISLEERKVIYRARRGLKEIDVYFDPYVKQHYLSACVEEKQMFADLVAQEDPDLLDWFMEVAEPPRPELKDFYSKTQTLCTWLVAISAETQSDWLVVSADDGCADFVAIGTAA